MSPVLITILSLILVAARANTNRRQSTDEPMIADGSKHEVDIALPESILIIEHRLNFILSMIQTLTNSLMLINIF